MDLVYVKQVLEQAGVLFAPGLTLIEVQQIEEEYGFTFPPDLKDFLLFALPISEGFINWRESDRDEIQRRLSWPYEGVCFDIEHNAFWIEEWGQKPSVLTDAFDIAKHAINNAPTLIPVYGHRYMPDRPSERGNPVFSVYQTDIIYYGSDLYDYLQNEFYQHFGRSKYQIEAEPKTIIFWSDLIELGNQLS